MADTSKLYEVTLAKWPNGSYGLLVEEPGTQTGVVDPVARWEVRETAKSKVATRLIAHLLGVDRTHAVFPLGQGVR